MTHPLDLDELERLTKAATPGPWTIGYSDGSGKFDAEEERFCLVDQPTDDVILHAKLCYREADAQLIAALNPQTALELIRLARLGREREEMLQMQERAEGLEGKWMTWGRQRALAEWAETHGVKALERVGRGILPYVDDALSRLPKER